MFLRAFAPVFFGLAAIMAQPVAAQTEAMRSYVIATAHEGGTYYPVGVAIALAAKVHLEGSQGIEVEAIPTNGSIENVALLRSGDVQFAIMQVLVGQWAQDGTGPFVDVGSQDEFRAVAMLWPDVAHFLISSDLSETGTVEDLRNLGGRAFAMGELGSGTEAINTFLFNNYGFPEGEWPLVYQGFNDAISSLDTGDVAALNIGAGVGTEAVQHALTRMGDRVTLLSVTEDEAARFDGGTGMVSVATITPGTYEGIDTPVQSIALPNFLAVRADVPEQDVYEITRALFENLGFLCEFHPAGCAVSLDAATTGLPIALHPGAERYFREMAAQANEAAAATE
jgi:hypothetical protein